MTRRQAQSLVAIEVLSGGHLANAVNLLAAQMREHKIPISRKRITNAVHDIVSHPERGFILLACVNGEGVGVAYVSFTYTLEHGGLNSWLDELYVLPGHRGMGIGKKLLLVARRRAHKLGCAAMDLEVEESHRRASHLYARDGFRSLQRQRWVRLL